MNQSILKAKQACESNYNIKRTPEYNSRIQFQIKIAFSIKIVLR
jgi:hypothetical protein